MLSLSTLSYFPSSQMSNLLSHWVCISSGLCEDTLAQEGSVTQLGALVRPARAGARLGLRFTSHFANLSPRSLSLHALWCCRLGGAFRDMAFLVLRETSLGPKPCPQPLSEPPLWSAGFLRTSSRC